MSEKGVYVLELEGGNYYVGYSDNMTRRIAQHFAGEGAQWTKKHPPVKIVAKHLGAGLQTEQEITKTLMATHGKNKVRGGSYNTSNKIKGTKSFTDTRKKRSTKAASKSKPAKKKSKTTGKYYNNRCSRCGREGHWKTSCYAKIHKDGYRL